MANSELDRSATEASQDVALYRAKLSLRRVRMEAWKRLNATKNDISSCWICSALLSSLNQTSTSTSQTESLLGVWQDLSAIHTCRNHPIVFPVRDEFVDQEVVLRKVANQRLVYVLPDAYSFKPLPALDAPWEGIDTSDHSSGFGDLRSSYHTDPGTPSPRLVDGSWIDLDMIRTWYHDCLEKHQDTCDLIESQPLSSPHMILIDTVQACLVRQDDPYRYLALSYVWGRANHFLTTKASFEQLCEPHALTNRVRLPQTIDQAVKLTRALGERYLWVDALCIVQDGADKVDHLNSMASIFANASLTIVAAQGIDADAGFQGLPGISGPRHIQQHIAPISPDLHLVKPSSKHVWDDFLLQPWSTRAWTFQESICSRRVLQFAHNSVRWCCRKSRWSEESQSSDCLRSYSSIEQRQLTLSSPQLTKVPLPALQELEILIDGFNVRRLTFPEDALSAFAGVSARLGAKFSQGLISGIPEMFFDLCLLWRPTRRLGPAYRRESRLISEEQSLPTWSWAGWVTEVTFPYTWNRHRDPAGPIAISFGNLQFYQVKFHYLDKRGSAIPVHNSWLSYARAVSDGQIPPGWSAHNVSDEEMEEYGHTDPVSFFRHESEVSLEFWFPVPNKPTPVPPRISMVLQFETLSGQFRLGQTRRLMTRIHALDGTPAGTLWQHDETDDDFLQATSGPMEERRPIELVAILGCTIPKDDMIIWDTDVLVIPRTYDENGEVSRTEDIYNVMWISREGELSSRKATGVILRSVWDTYAEDQVSVTLV